MVLKTPEVQPEAKKGGAGRFAWWWPGELSVGSEVMNIFRIFIDRMDR